MRLFLSLVLIFMIFMVLTMRQVPRCQEDQVLVGYGQFEAGRWTGYKCGPALDDFGGEG
jgi:hypothetical protein